MIKVRQSPASKYLLDVWCDKQDVEGIFALDCIAAMTPARLNYDLVKTCWYHVLVDARFDPGEAVLRIEALDVPVPEVFKAWEDSETLHSSGDSKS